MFLDRFCDFDLEPQKIRMVREFSSPKAVMKLTSITLNQFIKEFNSGDKDALNRLVSAVYDELLKVARSYRKRLGAGVTLDTKAIVHEAYEQIFKSDKLEFESRKHFYATVAQAMRWIICDYARKAKAEKRGGDRDQFSITSAAKLFPDQLQRSQMDQIDLILSIDRALNNLEKIDPEMTKLVNLRFFFGLSIEESAKALDISTRTVNREWRIAKLYLHKALAEFKDEV